MSGIDYQDSGHPVCQSVFSISSTSIYPHILSSTVMRNNLTTYVPNLSQIMLTSFEPISPRYLLPVFVISFLKLGIMVHVCNSNTWEAEARRSLQVQGQPGLTQQTQNKKEMNKPFPYVVFYTYSEIECMKNELRTCFRIQKKYMIIVSLRRWWFGQGFSYAICLCYPSCCYVRLSTTRHT